MSCLRYVRNLIAGASFWGWIGLLVLSGCSRSQQPAPAEPPPPQAETQGTDAHADHNPRHNGVFFMALDNEHHLEGVLLEPRTFRLYLYDSRTRPIEAPRLAETQATVYWGEYTEPPAIPLAPGTEAGALEALLDRTPQFPVTLTALVDFAGQKPDQKPELFTFTFDRYSEPVRKTTPADPSQHDDHPKH